MNLLGDSKIADTAQVQPVTSADVRNPKQRRVATSAAKDCAHSVPVKQQFADSFHCAASDAGRLSGCHFKSKNFVQQSACGVAVQSQIAVLHIAQPPVGPKRSVLMRSGS